MRLHILLSICGIVSAEFVYVNDNKLLHQQFQAFKKTHQRHYKDAAEEARRFSIFQDNLAAADGLNKREGALIHGVTKFSDWTAAEVRSHLLGVTKKSQRKLRRGDSGNHEATGWSAGTSNTVFKS